MSSPRILFFVPSLSVGGAERHTVDLCDGLRARGYSASIVVYQRKIASTFQKQLSGSDAIVLGLKGMSDLRGWITVWRLLRRLKPNVIISVNQTPFIMSAIERFAFATNAKLICIFHTTVLQHYEAHQEFLFRILVRFADLLVYVGRNQKTHWETRGLQARKVAVIRNGVDLQRFSSNIHERISVRDRLNLGHTDYVIGHLGAFRSEKNQQDLVRALINLRLAGIEPMVLFIGDGPTKRYIERFAMRNGVSNNIIFAGEQHDVPPLLRACDVGVLCSTVETFPLAAIEFLAAGVPMICSDVGGIPEIVRHGFNGIIYRSNDVGMLSDALLKVKDPLFRLSLASNARPSVASFSAESMFDNYAREIDALVEG